MAKQFRVRGITYVPADKSASQLYLEFMALINAGQVSLLDNRRLLDQLIGLERRTSFGTGRDSVGHPPGAHDDIANACAGACLLAFARPFPARMGTIGIDGFVTWKDPQPSRIRIENISEQEHLREKELRNG